MRPLPLAAVLVNALALAAAPAASAESAPNPAPAAAGAKAPAKPAPPKTPAEQARDAFQEGVAKGKAGAFEAAAEAFDKAFRLDASLVWAAYDAGVFFERAGDVGRARAAYEAALARKPDFVEASQALTRRRIRSGKAAEAEADLRARIQRFPAVLGFQNQLVEAIAAQGRLDDAEQEAKRILRTDEHNAPAMVSLASIFYEKKRYELARMVLDNARQVHPDDPAIWNKLAFVELASGNRAQALLHLQKAAALREDYAEAHINYGAMLVDAEDFAGAVRELELAVKHAPASAEAWLNLGNAYRGEKRFDDAKQAYDKALLLDPKAPEVQFDLAVLYLDLEKPGLPALERLEKGLAHLDKYAGTGAVEPRVAAYRKDAQAALEKERKRLAREEKDRLRKEAQAQKAEAEKAAAQKAEAEKADAQKPAATAGGPATAAAPKPNPAADPAPKEQK